MGGVFEHNITITKEMLDNVGASSGRPDTIPDYTVKSKCFYTSGRSPDRRRLARAPAREPDLELHRFPPTGVPLRDLRLGGRHGCAEQPLAHPPHLLLR